MVIIPAAALSGGSHEAVVAVGLVGENVGLAVVRRRAPVAALGAVDG
jgi:hypothetical protein